MSKQGSFKSYVSLHAYEQFQKETPSPPVTKKPEAEPEKEKGELEENTSPVPSPRTKRKIKMLKSQKSVSKPANPPPPVPVKAEGRRNLNRSQSQTQPKDVNAVVNQDVDATPEFLRVKLKSTKSVSDDKPRQSYTTDDVDELKRLSKKNTPTPPMRHKKFTTGSNPSSGQSSPKTGQLSKRKSYTTDDIDLITGSASSISASSVGGDLKKTSSVKPKAPPKPRIPQFAKRMNRDRTPERDKNHRVNDNSDQKSASKFKLTKHKQKSDDSNLVETKPRSKSLTHVFNRKVNNDSDKNNKPKIDVSKYACDSDSCDSDNGAMKPANNSHSIGITIEDSFDDFDTGNSHVYDNVYVGDDEEENTDDGTLTKKKSMRLLKEWGLDVRVHSDDENDAVETGTLKRDRLQVAADDDTDAFSTHEYSSFDSDSFDSSSDSDTSDLNNVSQNTSAMQQVLQDMEAESANMSPLHRKAHELLVTERGYVRKLKLIDQTFQFRIEMENKKQNMFPDDVLNQMFSNVKSIFQLHDAHLLPKLEERMENWESNEKIGDIVCTFAPFLKMYSEYVKNYDTGTTLLTNWYQKCPKFKAIIDELQSLPECGHLALQHHMLEPIQRVPRYEMLLKDYLKLLPEDSDDRADTERALNVVTTAAGHSNEAMKKIDKFRKVLDVHDKINGSIPDLVSPTRELVKEGKVMKVSRRKGALLERHLFLFNDLLLVCEQGIHLIRPSYSVRDKLSIDGMKVDRPGKQRDSQKDADSLIFEGDNPEVKYTFRVKSREKVLEFSASGMEEKDEWQAKLWTVVQDFLKKKSKSSLKPDDRLYDTGMSEDKIGMEAPNWVRDNSASMCMVCSMEFKAFRRRHHCRACGILVCNRCSDYRTKLQFDEKIHRVCKRCHDIIIAKGVIYAGGEGVEFCPGSTPQKTKGILQIKADDPSVMSGSLKISLDGGKTWNKRWFAIHTDFVLYSFKAKRDVAATNSTPLPGFQVKEVDDADNISEPNVFKLCHTHLTYFYQAPTISAKTRWMDVLGRVVKAEIPTIYINNPETEQEGECLSDSEPDE